MDSNDATANQAQEPDDQIKRIGDQRDEGRGNRGRFQKGVYSPSRSVGRPRGARNKLAEDFLADLARIWEEQGDAILRRAQFEQPMKFADMVARLLPAKIEIKDTTTDLDNWKDEHIFGLLAAIRHRMQEREAAKADRPMIDVTPSPAPAVVDPFEEFNAQLAREQREGGE